MALFSWTAFPSFRTLSSFSGIDMEAICLIRNELKFQEDVVLLLFVRLLKFEYISDNSTLYSLSRIFCKAISVSTKHFLRLSLYICPKNQLRNVWRRFVWCYRPHHLWLLPCYVFYTKYAFYNKLLFVYSILHLIPNAISKTPKIRLKYDNVWKWRLHSLMWFV